jgi:hypothetical protein
VAAAVSQFSYILPSYRKHHSCQSRSRLAYHQGRIGNSVKVNGDALSKSVRIVGSRRWIETRTLPCMLTIGWLTLPQLRCDFQDTFPNPCTRCTSSNTGKPCHVDPTFKSSARRRCAVRVYSSATIAETRAEQPKRRGQSGAMGWMGLRVSTSKCDKRALSLPDVRLPLESPRNSTSVDTSPEPSLKPIRDLPVAFSLDHVTTTIPHALGNLLFAGEDISVLFVECVNLGICYPRIVELTGTTQIFHLLLPICSYYTICSRPGERI